MYFPYGVWRDAERDARRLPDSKNNGCGTILALFIGGIVAFSFFKVGGLGIIFGLAVIVGMIQGMKK